MTDRFLVTGGAGFIGSHLVDRLVSEGFSVSVLDNLSTGDIRNLDQSINEIDFMQGDIRNQADVDAAVRDVDVVINLAALGSVPRSVADPMSTHEVNATGTLRMLLASRDAGARRFIQASSSSVYGDSHVLPKVETEMGRVASPYAASKCAAEDYCRLASDMYGLDTVRLRFFNVFGPRQKADHVYAAVIPKFVDWALRGETLVVH
ncbi:MAG: SDR family NAD(P)-dependent oxidoreductase, partial [Acidimicrobiia bacterium]|nr:SDR family NAD(P)-dependent oxidoreductase [Acidimicrobiia bacterium]